MAISKSNKEYTVTERKKSWKLSRKAGGLTIEYVIPKDICEDEAALRAYVEKEKIFL